MSENYQNVSAKPGFIRVIVPLIITGAVLIYSWMSFLTGEVNPFWRHYLALAGFVAVLLLLFKNRKLGTVALGIYLLIAITTIFSVGKGVTFSGFTIGSITIPIGDPLAWGLFIVYLIFNLGSVFEYYLDYKESKGGL